MVGSPLRRTPPAEDALLRSLLFSVLLLAALASQARAQRVEGGDGAAAPAVLPDTEVHDVRSAANGVAYRLYVARPPGYDEGDRRFPVLFLLDAHYSFAIARNVVEHLVERGDLPPVLVVAVGYATGPDSVRYSGTTEYRRNRTRDYTPTRSMEGGYGPEFQSLSGGAPEFARALREELIPFVERRFRVSDDRALVGHSYGGLFAVWIALRQPPLFDRILAVSPSLWYDDHLIFRLLDDRESLQAGELPKYFYGSVGARENRIMPEDLTRLGRTLEAKHAPMQTRIQVEEGETHNSVFPIGLARGLRWIYQDLGAR